jgi:hypothetical protein
MRPPYVGFLDWRSSRGVHSPFLDKGEHTECRISDLRVP